MNKLCTLQTRKHIIFVLIYVKMFTHSRKMERGNVHKFNGKKKTKFANAKGKNKRAYIIINMKPNSVYATQKPVQQYFHYCGKFPLKISAYLPTHDRI